MLVLLGLYFLGLPGATPAQTGDSGDNGSISAGSLVPLEKDFDFGSISMAKGKVKHMYAFKNGSAETLTIRKVYTSCMCTEANLILPGNTIGPFGMPGHAFSPTLNEKVVPGQTIEVEAIFDPAAHGPSGLGEINRAVILETSGGLAQVTFSANVTP